MADTANLQRGENVEAIVLAAARYWRVPPATASGCSSSTTDLLTGRGRSPTASPPSTDGWRSCIAPPRTASALPTFAGFRYSLERGAGFVMEMDSDFSHDPADLARLLDAVHAGADLALGSRYVPAAASATGACCAD